MDNGDAPVTKKDLDQVTKDILDGVREFVQESKREILEDVQEMVRDSQTEILKAFHPYQAGQEIRLRTLEVKLSNTDSGVTERMAILEHRLAEIERKLLMNPPAA